MITLPLFESGTPAKSLAQVNAAIQKVYPNIILVKGHDYFYITSDDEKMSLFIAGLYTSSIWVARIGQQAVETWVDDVKRLLEQGDSTDI